MFQKVGGTPSNTSYTFIRIKYSQYIVGFCSLKLDFPTSLFRMLCLNFSVMTAAAYS